MINAQGVNLLVKTVVMGSWSIAERHVTRETFAQRVCSIFLIVISINSEVQWYVLSKADVDLFVSSPWPVQISFIP